MKKKGEWLLTRVSTTSVAHKASNVKVSEEEDEWLLTQGASNARVKGQEKKWLVTRAQMVRFI